MERFAEDNTRIAMDRVRETETSTDADLTQRTTNGLKKLRLKRETVRHLGEELFTSQGHSLWTCDQTLDK
jgi:hypothetical protein